MKTNSLAMIVVALVLSGGTASADALRCGSALVETGISADELVAQCGEPASKDIEGGNWTYRLDGHTYVVRVSASGIVAEVNETSR